VRITDLNSCAHANPQVVSIGADIQCDSSDDFISPKWGRDAPHMSAQYEDLRFPHFPGRNTFTDQTSPGSRELGSFLRGFGPIIDL